MGQYAFVQARPALKIHEFIVIGLAGARIDNIVITAVDCRHGDNDHKARVTGIPASWWSVSVCYDVGLPHTRSVTKFFDCGAQQILRISGHVGSDGITTYQYEIIGQY